MPRFKTTITVQLEVSTDYTSAGDALCLFNTAARGEFFPVPVEQFPADVKGRIYSELSDEIRCYVKDMDDAAVRTLV